MSFKKLLLIFFASIAISFGLYGNTIGGQFIYDDIFFTRRAELSDPSHLGKIWFEAYLPYDKTRTTYRPLSIFSFSLNFVLFGNSPKSFHITNILLNGIVVFLVYILTLKLFGNPVLALFVALFYAFLPIHIDAVSFNKARDDILATLFSLFSWIIFLKAVDQGRSFKFLALSSFLWVLAVLGKEIAVVMPALFLLVFWMQKRPNIGALFKVASYFFFAALTYFSMRFIALGNDLLTRDYVYFILDPIREADFATRIWTSFKIAFIYISKTYLPINLSTTYSYNHLRLVSNFFQSWEVWLGMLFLASLILLVIYKKTRATAVGIGALAFLVPYAILSKFFVQLSEILSEKWMYLPSVGLSLMAGFVIYSLYKYRRWLGVAVLVVVLAIYAQVIIERRSIWLNQTTLGEGMVRDAPDSAFAHFTLSDAYYRQGKFKDAKSEIGKSLSIYEDYAPSMHLVALIALEEGNYTIAEKAIERATELRSGLPENYQLQALLFFKKGKYQASLDLISKLPKRIQEQPNMLFLLAINNYKLGRIDEAKKYLNWDNTTSEEEKLKILETF